MSIFESLENLNVSEECFDDIMDIVEDELTKRESQQYRAGKKVLKDREEKMDKACEKSTQAQIMYGDGEPEGVPYAEFEKNMREHVIPAWKERQRAVKRYRHAKKVVKKLGDKFRHDRPPKEEL